MNNLSSLDLILEEMINAGHKMIETATALREILSETTKSESTIEAPKKESLPEPEAKTYTFQEVRGLMANLSGNGKKADAKALLTKYGASRLSEVKEADYAALAAEAEVILNG